MRARRALVLGMHHTGTSIVANFSMALGMEGGEDLLMHPTNPLKYFEHRRTVELNAAYLRQNTPPSHFPAWVGWGFRHGATRATYRRNLSLIVADMPTDRPWIIKDPRLSLLAADWMAHIEDPLCVIVLRDPISTVDSLMRLSMRVSAMEWFGIYAVYYSRIMHACRSVDAIVVEHEDLLSRPYETLRHLASRLRRAGVKNVALPPRHAIERLVPPRPAPMPIATTTERVLATDAYRVHRAVRHARRTAVRSWPPSHHRLNESYVTLITRDRDEYIAGAGALAESIRTFDDGGRRMVALVLDDLDERVARALTGYGWAVERVAPIVEPWWDRSRCRRHNRDQHLRWGRMMTKLRVWSQPYDRVIYLDADSMLLAPPPARVHEFAAEPAKYHPYFNAGIMDIRPNRSVFESLMRRTRRPAPSAFGNVVDCTEQALLVDYFGKDVPRLSTGRADEDGVLVRSEIFALHWITHACSKPWLLRQAIAGCDADATRFWHRMHDRAVRRVHRAHALPPLGVLLSTRHVQGTLTVVQSLLFLAMLYVGAISCVRRKSQRSE